ncbi:uncharacterized protein LOC5499980 isoform X1 [Nematostella vectensis]|nr:uncharacterized protein LOC5499980 isoform X1 [Nematostella vectensis]
MAMRGGGLHFLTQEDEGFTVPNVESKIFHLLNLARTRSWDYCLRTSETMFLVSFVLVFSLGCKVIAQTCPQGVCYGGAFEATKRKQGRYLVGFSFKNLSTVRHAQGCFSACMNECLCRSYQVSSTGCELLEEDKDTSPSHFHSNPDYSYFEMHQKIIPSASSLAYPSVCRNGCCLANPCLNGGTCTEKCEHPKTKFVCKCLPYWDGRLCQHFRPKSCHDFYKAPNGPAKLNRGVYEIYSKNNTHFKVYCDFMPPYRAWTLIESFAFKHNPDFKTKSFLDNYPVNETSPDKHEKYRLSRDKMQHLRSTAVSYRVTCQFLKRSNVTKLDYLEGKLSSFDIIEEESLTNAGFCKTVDYVNIEGHDCRNCTLALFQKIEQWHLHSEPRKGNCDMKPSGYEVQSNEAFGFYDPGRDTFLCASAPDATTEYWLGHGY